MTRMVGVSQSWAALYPCAEPMCEAAENLSLSHVSSGVLVAVTQIKNTLFLAICASKLTATICNLQSRMPRVNNGVKFLTHHFFTKTHLAWPPCLACGVGQPAVRGIRAGQ